MLPSAPLRRFLLSSTLHHTSILLQSRRFTASSLLTKEDQRAEWPHIQEEELAILKQTKSKPLIKPDVIPELHTQIKRLKQRARPEDMRRVDLIVETFEKLDEDHKRLEKYLSDMIATAEESLAAKKRNGSGNP